MPLALTFPGQGSQAVGMGKAFAESYAEARHVFEEADDAIGFKLSKIIFEGPESDLTLTVNTQPAIMTTSVAILRVIEKQLGLTAAKAAYVAGHSLGEYSALCAAGSFTLADAARLLKLRGLAMQEAVPVGEGAMAAILGLEIDEIKSITDACASTDTCQIANDNCPGQVVISGAKRAIERAVDMAKERGAKRSVLLAVSAPFHCSLMFSAQQKMQQALEATTINKPVVPLIANVTAEEAEQPDVIRRLLIEQVTGMVRWRESVNYMVDNGVKTLVEIGHGNVLTGLTKRINREVRAISVSSPADLEALEKLLNEPIAA
ncbi:ACP S-malonyltransferase [bacterium]|nr:ACP S-malonyltransferase [bacterium]